MKKIVLSLSTVFTALFANAQFSQNFEQPIETLSSNCWTVDGVYRTTDPAEVISGTGSMYTNPPTNGSASRELTSPALNVTNTSFNVTFKYKLSTPLSGVATRTIEIGVLDATGIYTSLTVVSMNRNTPSTVQTFNQTFPLTLAGIKKLVVKFSGSTGDGNSRIILDDLTANAAPRYGTGSCNNAPVAVNDVFNGLSGQVVTGNILLNDNDPDNETITPSIVTNSGNGIVVLNPNGSFTFTPNSGFTGTVTSFTYQLTDNGYSPMQSNVATAQINLGSPIVTPVKLSAFSAVLNANQDKVELKWTTATETNVSHFIVEKSEDGRNYTEAGTVFAFGNSTEKKNYSLNDNNISLGSVKVIYYRLRSVDIDGKFDYSDIRVIRLNVSTDKAISISSYPNPATNQINITIPASWQNKKVVYEFVNMNGQVAKSIQSNSSSQTETIDIRSFAPAVYVIKASCEGQVSIQKIVKN